MSRQQSNALQRLWWQRSGRVLAATVEHGAHATIEYSTDQLTDRVIALTEGQAGQCVVPPDQLWIGVVDAILTLGMTMVARGWITRKELAAYQTALAQ